MSPTNTFAKSCPTEVLVLSGNTFTGPIPTSIGLQNDTLRGLYVSDNKLNGAIPESICDYINLEALHLDENEISGSLPACLGRLASLKQIYAFRNNLTGTVPAELSALRQLSKFTQHSAQHRFQAWYQRSLHWPLFFLDNSAHWNWTQWHYWRYFERNLRHHLLYGVLGRLRRWCTSTGVLVLHCMLPVQQLWLRLRWGSLNHELTQVTG